MKDDHYKMAEGGLRRYTAGERARQERRSNAMKNSRVGGVSAEYAYAGDGDPNKGSSSTQPNEGSSSEAEPTYCRTQPNQESSSEGTPEVEGGGNSEMPDQPEIGFLLSDEEISLRSEVRDRQRFRNEVLRDERRYTNTYDEMQQYSRKWTPGKNGLPGTAIPEPPFATGKQPVAKQPARYSRSSRIQSTHEARDERIKMAAHEQYNKERAEYDWDPWEDVVMY
jgi:hypothetical protein